MTLTRPSAARQGRPAAAPYWRVAKRADARARRLRSKIKRGLIKTPPSSPSCRPGSINSREIFHIRIDPVPSAVADHLACQSIKAWPVAFHYMAQHVEQQNLVRHGVRATGPAYFHRFWPGAAN